MEHLTPHRGAARASARRERADGNSPASGKECRLSSRASPTLACAPAWQGCGKYRRSTREGGRTLQLGGGTGRAQAVLSRQPARACSLSRHDRAATRLCHGCPGGAHHSGGSRDRSAPAKRRALRVHHRAGRQQAQALAIANGHHKRLQAADLLVLAPGPDAKEHLDALRLACGHCRTRRPCRRRSGAGAGSRASGNGRQRRRAALPEQSLQLASEPCLLPAWAGRPSGSAACTGRAPACETQAAHERRGEGAVGTSRALVAVPRRCATATRNAPNTWRRPCARILGPFPS